MLVRFYVTNYLSFADKTEISLIAGKNLPSDEQLTDLDGFRVLRGAVIYGANASGKSNLVKAIANAQSIILRSNEKEDLLPDKRFRLRKKASLKPTEFEFEFHSDNQTFSYGFSFYPDRVQEEWLYEIGPNTERLIFERDSGGLRLDRVRFSEKSAKERLKYMYEDLLPNQLYLTELNNRNISNIESSEVFLKVFNWFRSRLVVLFPQSRFRNWHFIDQDEKLYSLMKEFLSSFDTGIYDITLEKRARAEISNLIPEELLSQIEAKKTAATKYAIASPNYDHFIVENQNGKFIYREFCTTHRADEGDVVFHINEESDGTKRLTDFIPIFASLGNNDKIFIIDEIDRSLHTELTHALLNLFLHKSGIHQSQIVSTTHDVWLLNLDLFRKDEIWFVDKDKNGMSKLVSLHDFKPRKDTNIRNAYLKGRFGGVPLVDPVREIIKKR